MFGCQHKHARSSMLQRRKIDVQHMPEISQQRNKSLCSRCYLDLLSLQCISNYFRQKKQLVISSCNFHHSPKILIGA